MAGIRRQTRFCETGNFGSRIPPKHSWNFPRTTCSIANPHSFPVSFRGSDLHHIAKVFPTSSGSLPLVPSGFSPNKYLVHLIPSWHLFLWRSELMLGLSLHVAFHPSGSYTEFLHMATVVFQEVKPQWASTYQASHLLLPNWLWWVTWPSPESMWKGITQGCGYAEVWFIGCPWCNDQIQLLTGKVACISYKQQSIGRWFPLLTYEGKTTPKYILIETKIIPQVVVWLFLSLYFSNFWARNGARRTNWSFW